MQKLQISYVFEKSYYFICILRQIGDNLLMKNLKFPIVPNHFIGK